MVEAWITQVVIFVAVVLGVATRALMPYLKKLQMAEETGQTVQFQNKYKFTSIMAFLVAVISASMFFPQALANVPPQTPLFGTFWISFIYGFGMTSFVNSIVKSDTGGGASDEIKFVKKEEVTTTKPVEKDPEVTMTAKPKEDTASTAATSTTTTTNTAPK